MTTAHNFKLAIWAVIDRPYSLLRATFKALRDHIDREDLIESLIVGHTVQRLLVLTAECHCDEIQRRRNHAQKLALRGKDSHSIRAVGRCVDPAGAVNDRTVA